VNSIQFVKNSSLTSRALIIEIYNNFFACIYCIIFSHYLEESHKENHEECLIDNHEENYEESHEESHEECSIKLFTTI